MGRHGLLEVIELYTQSFAAFEVVSEGIERLRGFLWVFLREIDKIGAMR